MKPDLIVRSPNQSLALRLPTRALWTLFGVLVALVAIVGLSLMLGSYPLSASQVLHILWQQPSDEIGTTIVWEFRFPRALVSIMVGALLGLSGATLQNVTRNPLADPSLVGVSQGAGFAVVALTILMPELGYHYRPLFAFGGALLVAVLIQVLTTGRTGSATMRFILTGVGVAAFISAGTSALLTYGDIDRAMAALGWLAGSVHASNWQDVWLTASCLVLLLPALMWASRPMAAMRMGPEAATGLGVRVAFARFGLITLSVTLAAFAVAAVGPLGFVGLVAPHVTRRLTHSGVGLHLLITAGVGGLLVAVADLLGRTAFAPIQIPAGLVTAMIGVPIFVWLIVRQQAQSEL
ncbi:fe(3+) dicitrate transport system permease protein [Maritalea myrionectae]|uniref:Fe(3+) dicitrate transport system permease protein n=1 Tax=Maritalea myrionectae TaxID=454601 RepID=A0A2R4MG23_9HYPH|nr:iron ABC transporter permease [Maritalea myrionectae]AVX04836.1 fe(3+) dicitrate transport system permease protein [Maritalea myrionectae]